MPLLERAEDRERLELGLVLAALGILEERAFTPRKERAERAHDLALRASDGDRQATRQILILLAEPDQAYQYLPAWNDEAD